MINFNYETEFVLEDEAVYTDWLEKIIISENKVLGEIAYVFCDDEYLHNINMKYLQHDTLTDIISFDYTEGNVISGDIFISVERVKDNAVDFNTTFPAELKRVMVHGILHYCGYKDKTQLQSDIMRTKEEEKIKMFHVEL